MSWNISRYILQQAESGHLFQVPTLRFFHNGSQKPELQRCDRSISFRKPRCSAKLWTSEKRNPYILQGFATSKPQHLLNKHPLQTKPLPGSTVSVPFSISFFIVNQTKVAVCFIPRTLLPHFGSLLQLTLG